MRPWATPCPTPVRRFSRSSRGGRAEPDDGVARLLQSSCVTQTTTRPASAAPQVPHQRRRGRRVQVRGRLVQQDDVPFGQQRAGGGQPAPLTAGQRRAGRADRWCPARRAGRRAGRRARSRRVRRASGSLGDRQPARCGQGEVGPDGRGEHVRLLRQPRHPRPQVVPGELGRRRRRPPSYVPARGRSAAISTASNVDLPEPDGPRTTSQPSPAAARAVRPRSTSGRRASRRRGRRSPAR